MADEFAAQAQDAAAAPGVTPGQAGGDTQAAESSETTQGQTRDEQGRFAEAGGDAIPDQVTVTRAELEAIQKWGTQAEQLAKEKQVAEERLALYEQALRATGQTAAPQQQQNVYNSGHPNPSAYNFQDPQTPEQEDPFGGIGDEEFLTGAELKRAMQGMASKLQSGQTQTQVQLQQALYLAQNPGAAQELKEKLPVLLQKAPALADAIKNSPNPIQTAHSLISLMGQPQQSNAPDPGETLKRIMANASQPGNASGAGGGGGGGISSASRIASMTGAEFEAYKEDVKAGRIRPGQ
ncbi:MAG: hypothetical protein JEY79_17335 [Pseudodesulfovibrio sp.]|nr:hypothetical protein [Pseudodesulfovibrio sp.]